MNATLLKADSRTFPWLEYIKGRRVHVVTSPPYNLGKLYRDGQTAINDRLSYQDWFQTISHTLLSLQGAGPGSTCWVQCNEATRKNVIGEGWETARFIWMSSGTVPDSGGERSWGRFSPTRSDERAHHCWEWVIRLKLGPNYTAKMNRVHPILGVPYVDQSNVKRWAHGRDRRCRGDVWCVPHETNASRHHPCPFPSRLVEFCLAAADAQPGDLVVDPWCGIGNTGVAAKKFGCDFLGVDLSQQYLDFARLLIDQNGQKNEAV